MEGKYARLDPPTDNSDEFIIRMDRASALYLTLALTHIPEDSPLAYLRDQITARIVGDPATKARLHRYEREHPTP